jgi:hypothetical protein
MASAMASTLSGMAMGRSGADSFPPPLIRQGLTRILSSSTATLRIDRRRRYAFSGWVLPGCSARAVPNHFRTLSKVMSPSATSAKVGLNCCLFRVVGV